MKKATIVITAAALLLGLAYFASCKKAEVEAGSISVQLSAGVSGSPAAGKYELNVGDTLAYNYTLEPGYSKLTVLLDDEAVPARGVITVSGTHFLKAYSDDNLEYKLTVQVNEGVTGTPAAGTYYYRKDTKVPYSYALAGGYQALTVKLNGSDVAASGTVTVSQDTVLYASAQVKHDVRGSWNLSESYSDGSVFQVVVTFSGTLFAGTVTDSEGGAGTYDYNDATLDFTLVFPDVTYKYSDGEFTDADNMGGDCKRYQSETSAVSGTWKATRIKAAAFGTPNSTGKGKIFRR